MAWHTSSHEGWAWVAYILGRGSRWRAAQSVAPSSADCGGNKWQEAPSTSTTIPHSWHGPPCGANSVPVARLQAALGVQLRPLELHMLPAVAAVRGQKERGGAWLRCGGGRQLGQERGWA